MVLALHGAGYAGTERHVRSLALGLHRRGWKVSLVSSLEGPLVDAVKDAGIPAYLVERTTNASYLTGMIRLLRRLGPDLLHAHSGLLPGLAARWAGVGKVLETRHGLPGRMGEIPGYQTSPPAGERWSWRLADHTLAVCRADAEWLSRNLGMPPGRIDVVPNGLPPRAGDPASSTLRNRLRAEWGVSDSVQVLGFIGRLRQEKAPHRLLDLLSWLIRQEDRQEDRQEAAPEGGFVLAVVGEGPDEPDLRERASALGLDSRMRWLGVVPEAEHLLPAMDHLLLPSLYEGAPYVVLEALQAGIPVTATPVGGLPEILRGDVLAGGLLPWSAESWGRRALDLAGRRESREEWRKASGRAAVEFGENRMLDGIESVYRRILTG